MKRNLCELSDVVSPGDGNSVNGIINVILKSQYKINRLAFSLKDELFLNKNDDLVFEYQVNTPEFVKIDILSGDIGFPEIQIENNKGEVYRFKRGNLKDFINIQKIDEICNVRIPLSSFLYNFDLKSNAKQSSDFFSYPVRKVSLDFLSNSNNEISLNIINPRLEPSFSALPDVFDLLVFERVNANKDIPMFISESSSISLCISKNTFCSHVYPHDLKLKWELSTDKELKAHGEVCVSNSNSYFEIPISKYGESSLAIFLFNETGKVAESITSVVKTYEKAKNPCLKIGVSDEFCFSDINNLGGKYRRFVLNLSSIAKYKDTYRFLHNKNPLSLFSSCSENDFLISLKGMPRWLSKKSDSADFHRYGPNSLEEYKRVIDWLLEQLPSDRVYAIESWNEANVIHEWADSFDELKSIQKVLWTSAKESKNQLKILSPSSTSWDFSFFKNLYNEGIYEYCHGLSMHAYTYTPQNHKNLFSELDKIIDLVSAGRDDFSAFITEVGFRTPAYTNFDQATYLVLFSLEVFFRDNYKSLLWFRYKNSKSESLSNYNQNASCGYAMVGYGEKYARGIFSAYRYLDNILSATIPKGIDYFKDETVFTGEIEGRLLKISYSERKLHEFIHNHNLTHVNVFDIFGNSLEINDINRNKIVFICY